MARGFESLAAQGLSMLSLHVISVLLWLQVSWQLQEFPVGLNVRVRLSFSVGSVIQSVQGEPCGK